MCVSRYRWQLVDIGDPFSYFDHSQAVTPTQIYHTMLLMLREGPNKESIDSYAKHEAMNEIIIAALSPMYANPKEFPKFTETVMSLPFIVLAPFVYCSTSLTTTCIQA